jgi:hypothetical protein
MPSAPRNTVTERGKPVARIGPVGVLSGLKRGSTPYQGKCRFDRPAASGLLGSASSAGPEGKSLKRHLEGSAIVRCVSSSRSRGVRALLRDDPDIVVWWGSLIECWLLFRGSREHYQPRR